MKAHYIANQSEQRKLAVEVAKEEIKRQKAEVCPGCEQNTANQVAAVMCKALNTRYGFGKERLKQVITDAENLFELCAIDGKRFNAGQAGFYRN